MMKLYSFLFCLFSIGVFYSQNNTPNILLIIADDVGIDVTNGYQTSAVMPTTPTLDSLRQSGVTYRNNWSTPSCTPTRASIMSGKFGIKTGVMRPPGNLDLVHTSLFTKLGQVNSNYAKAVIGKWHISNPVDYTHPAQHGVDHYEGAFTSAVGDYYNWDKVENEMLTNSTTYATEDFTDAAIDWIGDQNQPWFLWLAHVAPHSPFHIPPDGTYSIPQSSLMGGDQTTRRRNRYIAAIESMDYQIDRLIDSFDEETKNNTVIIYIGDNGTPGPVVQNFQSNHAKGSVYEGGIRVPLFISGKGVSRAGEDENGLTHAADLHATILELAGYQVDGGINNSLSLKSSLSCENTINREYIYTDYDNSGTLEWAIREDEYKLIEDENGNQEFYNVATDIFEQTDLLIGGLDATQQAIFDALEDEAAVIRAVNSWSCNDGILNGTEEGIDGCNDTCTADDTLTKDDIGCMNIPSEPSVYYEYIEADKRKIYSNNFPDHNYGYNSPMQMPEQMYHFFNIDADPVISGSTTKVISDNGRPARFFGVLNNGVILAPAPAQPFIFRNTSTGQFNWDWVFEPTNNSGSGTDLVGLDCSSAHTGPQGYHYHGDMIEYIEGVEPGISTTDTPPSEPVHLGWAADGFPIVYRFGPDSDGNIKKMLPSFQLKQGLRPGDGISAPCGVYNGKFTEDYEYICGKGDLDDCNGIHADITITTMAGTKTFGYYYVVTSTFPEVPRCLKGNVSSDFDNSATQPTGNDIDNDGFIEQFDCDDNDSSINPLATGMIGEGINVSCSSVLSSQDITATNNLNISVSSENNVIIRYNGISNSIDAKLYNINGQLIESLQARGEVSFKGLTPGIYLLKVKPENKKSMIRKILI